MAQQILAPGVYVNEVPSAIKPLAGVSTSTAGFIGVVADTVLMPLLPGQAPTSTRTASNTYALAAAGTPVLITSWDGFTRAFGELQAGNLLLAHAVYGFFNNGGSRCWVARLAPAAAAEGATSSTATANDINLIGSDDLNEVLNRFAAIDEISLVLAPGATAQGLQVALMNHCERIQTCFAILDAKSAPTELTKSAMTDVGNSSYAALYFPWVLTYDSVSKSNILVPPSGHIAGVYARVDGSRGVHKAPANEVIRGVLGVGQAVSQSEQAALNQAGVNVIRNFQNNITVWGARTLASLGNEPEWKYINLRRLFIYLRQSIQQGTQWVVFEPNAPDLWARVRRNINAFLTNVWRSGALFGATPEQAFYVRCDEGNNPLEMRLLGQVIIEIGVAPVLPAEFVIFYISQWAGSEG